jgi:peroxiredoxin Q/BCP
VWQEKSMYGRNYWGNARTTVIIDRDGRVAEIMEKVKPEMHAEQVAEALSRLG